MMRRLQDLQQRAQRLAQVAGEFAAAAPHQVEGADATGYVLVSLGSGGLPDDICVRARWQEHLHEDRLAAAVIEARSVAVRARQRLWIQQIDDSGLEQRRRDLQEGATPVVQAPAPSLGGRAHPDDPEFSERVIKALREARQHAVTSCPAPPAQGTDATCHVMLRLGPGGLIGCEIDPRWACNATADAISTALRTALRQALREYQSASPQPCEVDDLVQDALATFSFLARNRQFRGCRR
jgi:hypothetical protein